jgi:MFS family permease
MRSSGNLRATVAGRGFRRLLGVRLVSQYADGLFQAGLAGTVLFSPERQPGPAAIASGFAVLLLPYSLVGPFVGVFLDRWSRRSVLSGANLLRFLLVLPAAALVVAHAEGLSFALLALGVIAVNRLFLAGLSAAQPHVVPDPLLVTANATAATLGTLCYAGGLVTAVLVPATDRGYAGLVLAAALGYLLSATAARVWFRYDELGPEAGARPTASIGAALVTVARGMVAGFAHLVRRRAPGAALLAQATHRALYGVLTMMVLVLYRRTFYPDQPHATMAGLGQIVLAGGLGALLAAFVTPPVVRRIGGWRWISLMMAVVGVTVVALGLPMLPVLFTVAVFVMNVAAQGTKIVVDTMLQYECDDDYRGRVFSINDTAFNLAFVVGLYVGSLVLPPDGRSAVVVVAVGIGYLLLALGYGAGAARRTRRGLEPVVVPTR